MNIFNFFSNLPSFYRAIIHGQWISLLIAGTGVFATILSNNDPNANIPLLMNFCNYFLLSSYLLRGNFINYINFFSSHISNQELNQTSNPMEVEKMKANCKNDDMPSSEVFGTGDKTDMKIFYYILAAFLDVEANFLVLEAYNYTTITSVMLLDCFTIPSVMVLSYSLLQYRYTYKHIFGTLICLAGLACIIINDALNGDSNGDNPIVGDVLCLAGAFLYACANVLQEYLVKNSDREKYMGYLGGFGMVISFCQMMLVDLKKIQRTDFNLKVIFSMIGFILCLFFMYINTSSFLQSNDAIFFNLGLLTSDVYAVIFSYFFYSSLVSWLYFIAFFLVVLGLFIYHSEAQPIDVSKSYPNQNESSIDSLSPSASLIDTNQSIYVP